MRDSALGITPTTDKIMPHTYHLVYGALLAPLASLHGAKFKMLGCTMAYGPGASARLWRGLFPGAEIWVADVNDACVRAQHEGKLDGFHVLVGRQGDKAVLQDWVRQSGGGFHANR